MVIVIRNRRQVAPCRTFANVSPCDATSLSHVQLRPDLLIPHTWILRDSRFTTDDCTDRVDRLHHLVLLVLALYAQFSCISNSSASRMVEESWVHFYPDIHECCWHSVSFPADFDAAILACDASFHPALLLLLLRMALSTRGSSASAALVNSKVE